MDCSPLVRVVSLRACYGSSCPRCCIPGIHHTDLASVMDPALLTAFTCYSFLLSTVLRSYTSRGASNFLSCLAFLKRITSPCCSDISWQGCDPPRFFWLYRDILSGSVAGQPLDERAAFVTSRWSVAGANVSAADPRIPDLDEIELCLAIGIWLLPPVRG